MIKVFMGMPSTGSREEFQNYFIREMQEEYKDKITLVYPKTCVYRMFHDHARNAITEEFLASDCDILWFLDSDVIPHPKVLDIVLDHEKWKLAGAPYPVFIIPPGQKSLQVVFTVYKRNERGLYAAGIPMEGIEEVEGIATGCIFIKKEVFNKLNKPYFEFKYHTETRDIVEGEDLGFCRKTSDLGYKFYVDYSKVCGHMKKVNLLDVNNYAMQYVNIAIQEYDKRINSSLTRLKIKSLSANKSGSAEPAQKQQ